MFEHSYWMSYLCVAMASGFVGLALLAYRAGLDKPVPSFPVAGVGFVGAGVVCALCSGVAYARELDDGGLLVALIFAGVATPVIGWVASLFSPSDVEDAAE